MITEKAFVINAVHGLVMSLAFASVVILIATLNIFVTLYSVITIACVLSSVIGTMQWIGWNLGIAESLAVALFVGIAVDYIVPLSH